MERFFKSKEKSASSHSEESDLFSDQFGAEDSRPGPSGNFPFNRWKRHTSEPTIQRAGKDSLSVHEYSRQPPSRHGSFEPGAAPPAYSAGTSFSANSPLPNNPLGLTLVHSVPNPVIDLVFIHGLGGTSIGTWSWNREPANYWPLWLAHDPDLSRSRIFTFGYDAGIMSESFGLGILDFAKDLLFRMKTYSPDLTDDQMGAGFGSLPIIFVVHSMGGLVFKKAFILGKHDDKFSDVIENVKGVVFLGTPHRGSQLAQTLSNIFRASPVGTTKQYVSELERNSGSLQDINEQFRSMYDDLHLVSFYESLKTTLGPGLKRMIVDKESGILGYSEEFSSALQADHHNMAKFENPLDANFTSVSMALRWLMKNVVGPEYKIIDPLAGLSLAESAVTIDTKSVDIPVETYVEQLQKILGITDNVEEDNDLFSERIMQGSCQWLLRRKGLTEWLSTESKSSQVLWLTGPPGSGKSVLSSFMIGQLRDRPSPMDSCQHHYFSGGHRQKRTISYLLRSIAFQAAVSLPNFRSQLIDLHQGADITFERQKVSFIWEKIFEGLLMRMPDHSRMFWVIDGLDEAESPNEFLRLLSKTKSTVKLNIMLVSRPTKDLANDIADLLPSTISESLIASDTAGDIRDYVVSAIQRIFPQGSHRDDIVQDIVKKASGSFLWVKLALEKLKDSWYTEDDIRKALSELPMGMESLYERMMESVLQQPEKTRAIALDILRWVTCAFVPLEVTDLEEALRPKFKGFVNLGKMAEEICGQFVSVTKSKITLVHHTARQFLLRRSPQSPLGKAERDNHKDVALTCMQFLSDAPIWRQVFSSMQLSPQSRGPIAFKSHPFLLYSLSFWTYHVSQAPATGISDEFLDDVLEFLEQYCLLWINGVVLTGDLRILIRAAQDLKTFVKRRTAKNGRTGGYPLSLTSTRDPELRQWANDIIRIVGRFGSNLHDSPSSIHRHVIPFCPKDTIIARTYGPYHRLHSPFTVDGVASLNWDDCLARLSIGDGRIASQILCKDAVLVTLIATGGVMIIFRAETLQEVRRISHGEYVMQITSSKISNLVATAGFKTIRVWDIVTGDELQRMSKERHHHVKALAFGEMDTELYVAFDDGEVKCFDIQNGLEKWRFWAKERESENYSCARSMSFSHDQSKMASIFRGRPLILWHLQPSDSDEEYLPPRKCVLAEDRLRSAAGGDAFNNPEVAIWHPVTGHLLILYEDTKIVEWNIVDDEQLVCSHTRARSMTLSHDGSFLLTSDVDGSLSIWSIPGYRLIYQMKHEELVTDLAFSPDGTRLYDLRGSFCNVWEPDVLIRADDLDHDDESSINETITSEPVLASDDHSRVAITSLACGPSPQFYCAGKEDGSVTIYDMQTGERARKVTGHSTSSSIIQLKWSDTGRFLVSVDDSGRFIVKRVDAPTPKKDKWAVFPICDVRMGNNDAIEHIHFSAGEEFLFIASSTSGCVWNLKAKTEVCRSSLSPHEGIWLNHPKSSTQMVLIGGTDELQYKWKDLSPAVLSEQSPSESRHGLSSGDHGHKVQEVVLIGKKWLLMEVTSDSHGEHAAPRRYFELLDLATIELNPEPNGRRATRYQIEGLEDHMRELIGCFQDRVVFLDHQFWVCTWEVERNYTRHKRHFFLPKDWINPTTLKMVFINKHGHILCPKGGNVAIIKSGI